jgi:hypothetical protein
MHLQNPLPRQCTGKEGKTKEEKKKELNIPSQPSFLKRKKVGYRGHHAVRALSTCISISAFEQLTNLCQFDIKVMPLDDM